MKSSTLDKTTVGFGISAAVMIVFNTVLVISKELMPALKKSMAAAMGHHWTTHGAIVLVFFIVLGLVLSGTVKPDSMSGSALGKTIISAVILGTVLLAGFYLMH